MLTSTDFEPPILPFRKKKPNPSTIAAPTITPRMPMPPLPPESAIIHLHCEYQARHETVRATNNAAADLRFQRLR